MSPTSYQTAPPRGEVVECTRLTGRQATAPNPTMDRLADGLRAPARSPAPAPAVAVGVAAGGGGSYAESPSFGGGGGGGVDAAPAGDAVGAAAGDSGARVNGPC